MKKIKGFYFAGTLICFIIIYNSCYSKYQNVDVPVTNKKIGNITKDTIVDPRIVDTIIYIKKMQELARGDASGRWPPKNSFPKIGAILPFNRIVAFYGNFYSKNMGVLGEYPADKMIEKLNRELKTWQHEDTLTPVLPAIHYIAVVAQGSPGSDGKYRLRMPQEEIDRAIELAKKVEGIVFLDLQIGLSTLETEIPLLKKYLSMPQVHLGIDPEYSMKNGKRPGSSVGTFDAADINYASEYLSALVNEFNLPPKILIVHRFRTDMLTNYKKIKTRHEVQIVMNMDGFGSPDLKKESYHYVVFKEPVQFAGFKLFYKPDVQAGKRLMTPGEILKLIPQPIYIQYQ